MNALVDRPTIGTARPGGECVVSGTRRLKLGRKVMLFFVPNDAFIGRCFVFVCVGASHYLMEIKWFRPTITKDNSIST